MSKIFEFAEEHCIMCGAVIPEGRQVCPLCEQDQKHAPNQLIDWRRGIPAPGLACKIHLWLRGTLLR